VGERERSESTVSHPVAAGVTVDVRVDGQLEVTSPRGARLVMGGESAPGRAAPWQPAELLMAALGACMAMDVRAILVKSRATPEQGRVTVLVTERAEGTPGRPFLGFELTHEWASPVERRVVERAIRLAAERYCTVQLTLELGPQVAHRLAAESSEAR